MARPIIIDCDPGVDDCLALMTALASPDELDLLGICTVAGNVRLDTCTQNTLSLVDLSGRPDVPVYAGCPRPLVEAPVFADHIHGETGLGNARLPTPQRAAEPRHAVDFLIDTLSAADDASITLVPLGPLTNLAVAFVKAPQITSKIKEIVLMGGAYRAGGNITASAEFNMFADPHAARVVFECGRPITAIGLDATLQFRCTPERHAALRSLGTPAGDAAAAMVDHVNRVYGEVYGADGAALHDPCTIGYLLAPDLFDTRAAHIRVECNPGLTRGHTAVDFYNLGEQPSNALWVDHLDAARLFDLLLERIGRL